MRKTKEYEVYRHKDLWDMWHLGPDSLSHDIETRILVKKLKDAQATNCLQTFLHCN